jgi:hypothetical protein
LACRLAVEDGGRVTIASDSLTEDVTVAKKKKAAKKSAKKKAKKKK